MKIEPQQFMFKDNALSGQHFVHNDSSSKVNLRSASRECKSENVHIIPKNKK